MDISQEILSGITVFNKYAKYDVKKTRRETWPEICDRNKAMHIKKFPSLKKEINDIYRDFVLPKKVLPSMRSAQFAGAPIELSNNRIFNCAYAAIDHIDVFSEAMFLLLGGTGFGYSVQEHHIAQLPIVKGPAEKTRRFLVGDSIEGWADAIKVLMKAYFNGKSTPIFDYRDIRAKGARLVTSGGKAPGPDPLRLCIDQVTAVLNRAVGRGLTPIEAHDILCFIADAVLSGGIRRAALIALFSHTDMDMLSSKSGRWWEKNPQRGRANNSVVLLRGETTEEQFKAIWERVKLSGAGEPGIFWTNDLELGTNPCVTGDTLVAVVDHGAVENGETISHGVVYQIPMKMLVELYETSTMPPMIVSYNLETGALSTDTLDAAALTRKNADVIKLTMSDGSFIKVTPDHRVFTENRGWVEAKDLTAADVLVSMGM